MFKKKIKLDLSPANAFALARFIMNNDLLSSLKEAAVSVNKNQTIEQRGFDMIGNILMKALELEQEVGELFDKILGVKNSLKALQLGDIFDAFMRDNQIKKVKAFFDSAFKQVKE